MKLNYGDYFQIKGSKKKHKIITANKERVFYGSFADVIERHKFEEGVKNKEIILLK